MRESPPKEMVFSSLTFLFVFLPLVLLAYYLSPRKLRNGILLVASLLFYAWGEGLFVAVMLASLATNYLAGLLLDRHSGKSSARWVLTIFVTLNLSLLGVYKYANFLVDNLNVLLGLVGTEPLAVDPVHLPIGISFFTFQALSYLVDVYRREAEADKNPLHVALYIALFPQLIAGPIVRYHDVARQIIERTHSCAGFALGVRRFIVGLAKKVLLANVLGAAADEIFARPTGELAPEVAWLGVICYAFQIYFDFSGYSDMAIGAGRMFGFRFLENFNYPYVATSIRDFWRRWHISLSTWFRDYLFVPMGGSRVKPLHTYFNLVVVFLLCGLWHGASWSFVVWGLFHGVFLVLERLGLGRLLARSWRPLRHGYTLLVVLVGWVFFRADTLSGALAYLARMFSLPPDDAGLMPLRGAMTNEVATMLVLALLASTPLFRRLGAERLEAPPTFALPVAAGGSLLRGALVAGLFLASVVYLTAGTYNPFIYFRF